MGIDEVVLRPPDFEHTPAHVLGRFVLGSPKLGGNKRRVGHEALGHQRLEDVGFENACATAKEGNEDHAAALEELATGSQNAAELSAVIGAQLELEPVIAIFEL